MKRKRIEENTGYWKSTSDMLMGLLMIILLLLMLFILIIMNTQEEHPYYTDNAPGAYDYIDPDIGANEQNNAGQGQGDDVSKYPIYGSGAGAGAGSGGNGTGVDAPGEDEYSVPTVPVQPENTQKAAVYVIVQDAESQSTIRKDEITFQLFSKRDGLQKLHTYYPEYLQYEDYSTQADGTFYLPEKIATGEYYFKDLTAPEGYDLAEDTSFTVERDYDWPEAYTVFVPLMPSKNYIRLQVTDRSAGTGLTGSRYEVVAAHDIVTADGTVRYRKGEVAATITVDETGYGESAEIYLGEYLIRQKVVPFSYAKWETNPTVTVAKKDGTLPPLQQTEVEKTTVLVYLKDEYDTNVKLANAAFKLTDQYGNASEVLTNDLGILTITDLDKNMTYTLQQISSVDYYRYSDKEESFTVDETGRVDGKVEQALDFKNYVISIDVSVTGMILRMELKNCQVTLRDNTEIIINQWINSDLYAPQKINSAGKYTLTVGDTPFQGTVQKKISVADEGGVQKFTIQVWTLADIVLLCLITLVLIGGAILFIYHRKTKKKDGEE